MGANLGNWLDERFGWRAVWETIFLRKIPHVNWLYTLGSDGQVHAWDVSGTKPKNVWKMNLYDRYQAPRRPKVGRSGRRDYGYTSSPLVVRHMLIIEVGASSGNLIGFDKKTGNELWRSQATDPAGHNGGPVPITVEGIPCLAVHHFNGLLVARIDRGHEGETVAEYPWRTNFGNNITTVAVDGNSVLLTSGYNQARIARLDISLRGATRVWEQREVSKVCSPWCIYRDRLLRSASSRATQRWSGSQNRPKGAALVKFPHRQSLMGATIPPLPEAGLLF